MLIFDLLFPECEESGLWMIVSQRKHRFRLATENVFSVLRWKVWVFSLPRIGYSDQQNVAFEINPRWSCFSMRLEKVTRIYTFVWLNCGDTSNGSDHFSRWWQRSKNWQVDLSAFHSLCLRVCTRACRSMCVCPITVSVSVLCIFSFLYRQTVIWWWLDRIFIFTVCKSYSDTVCRTANCYVFYNSSVYEGPRPAGAAATIALTSDRSAGQLQLRRKEGRGRGGWLEREREG